MKKKLLTAVVLVFSAVALVVVSVLGTIAYLTASSAVSNVFTIGDVKISMFETKVDTNGVPVEPHTEVDANSYHLVAGKTYTKDPTIRIHQNLANGLGQKSDTMFLFVKSSNQIREIEAANVTGATDTTPRSMREQMEANGWVQLVKDASGIEIVWVYGTRKADGTIVPTAVTSDYKQVLGKDANGNDIKGPAGEIRLCESFTVDPNVSNLSLFAAAKVNFTAFAIQTSGFDEENDTTNANVKNAWAAIKETYPYEGGIAIPQNPYNSSTTEPYAPVPKPDYVPPVVSEENN